MYISKYNSSKITILNSVLIMMVLYIHSYYLEGEKYDMALAIQRFFGAGGISGTANRLFFFMSGMLFFNGITQVKDCLPKMKKRVRSLLIPYLIWNVIFVLWYVVLHFTPGVSSFVNSNIFANFDTVWNGFHFLWISPASFPLWFLRDLMCMVVLSPVIYLFLRYTKWVGVTAFLLFSLLVPNSGTFFVMGASIAMLSNLETVEKFLTPTVVACCTLIFLGSCMYVAVMPIEYHIPVLLDFVMGITGIVATWRGYDLIARGRSLTKGSFWSGIMGYSFFIYLFHEPTLNIIKKIPLRLMGDSEATVLLCFFLSPVIMALIAIAVAKVLQRIMPKTYSVMVGGR